jgi:hypothetical protein
MKARVLASVWLFSLLIAMCLPAQARATKCSIRYTLQGWSAFYKTASGTGTITCDDGQSAAVSIRATGGGLTIGKSKVSDGRGKFSDVASVSELFGAYADAEAHAGMGPSSSAQVMTKGTVSLELTGTGQGVDLGFSFGKFTISKRK